MKRTISSKGQITVPAAIRERLGLSPGTSVLFEMHEGGVLLRNGVLGEQPVDQVYGILNPDRPVDALALLDEFRGPRPGGPRARRRR